MASVNRFMKPVERQVRDTYVSQYVPLPFEAMKKRALEMEAQYEEGQKGVVSMMSVLNPDVNTVDKEMLLEKSNELSSQVESALEEVDGDYGALQPYIRKLSNETNAWLSAKEGKTAIDNRKIELENRKKVDESKMSSKDKQEGVIVDQLVYEAQGGAKKGAKYRTRQVYEPFDLLKDINASLSQLKTNDGSKPYIYAQEVGGADFVVTGFDDSKKLSKERIAEQIASYKNHEGFLSMADYKWQNYNMLNNVLSNNPKAIKDEEEFKDALFSQMTGDRKYKNEKGEEITIHTLEEAHAYKQEQKRRNVQRVIENSPSGSGTGLPNGVGISVVSEISMPISAEKQKELNKFKEKGADQYQILLDNEATTLTHSFDFENVKNGAFMKEILIQNPSLQPLQAHKDFIKHVASYIPMFKNMDDDTIYKAIQANPYLQKQIIREIGEGRIDLEKGKTAVTKEQAFNMRENAKVMTSKFKEQEVIIDDAYRYLKDNHPDLFSEEDYNNVNGIRLKYEDSLSVLNRESIAKNPNLSAQEKKEIETIRINLLKYGNNLATDPSAEDLQKFQDEYKKLKAKSVLTKEEEAKIERNTLTGERYAGIREEGLAIAKERALLEKTQKVFQKEKQSINAYLLKRAGEVENYQKQSLQDLVVDYKGKNGKDESLSISRFLTDRKMGNGKLSILEINAQSILSAPITDDNGKSTTIKEDLIARGNKQFKGQDLKDPNILEQYNKFIGQIRSEVFNMVLFLNETDNQGNGIMNLGGRYNVSLNSRFKINGLFTPSNDGKPPLINESKRNEMVFNSYVRRAKSSLASKYPIPGFEGVFIKIDNDGSSRVILDGSFNKETNLSTERNKEDDNVYALTSSQMESFKKLLVLYMKNPPEEVSNGKKSMGEFLHEKLK